MSADAFTRLCFQDAIKMQYYITIHQSSDPNDYILFNILDSCKELDISEPNSYKPDWMGSLVRAHRLDNPIVGPSLKTGGLR